MPVRININGVGTVTLGDEFLELSPEEQDATIDEIAQSRQTQESPSITSEKPEQSSGFQTSGKGKLPTHARSESQETTNVPQDDSDNWIGQTFGGVTGATGGALGGAALGTLIFPGFGTAIGAVLGGILGGGAGGAAGEAIELSIGNAFDNDSTTKWNELSDQQQDEIIAAGIEEGIFGAIPGGGGAIAKGTRVLVQGKVGAAKGWLKNKIASILRTKGFQKGYEKTGSVVGGHIAGDAALKATNWFLNNTAVSRVSKLIGTLNDKQKKEILDPLVNQFIKDTAAASKKTGRGKVKFSDKLKKDLVDYAYGSQEKLEEFFKRAANSPAGKAAIEKWAKSDAVKNILKGAGITGAIGVAKGATDIEVDTPVQGYNEGGEVHPSFAPVTEQEKNISGKGEDTFEFLIGFLPGYGEAQDAKLVGDALAEGDYTEASIAGGLGLLGAVPVVGDVASKGIKALRKTKNARKTDVDAIQAQKTNESAGYLDIDKGARMVPDGKGGHRPMTQGDLGGWDYQGKGFGAQEDANKRFIAKKERQAGMTDAERDLDDKGLYDLYQKELVGISSPEDLNLAQKIAIELENPSKGNYTPQMIIGDVLKSTPSSKSLSLEGLVQALSSLTGMDPKKALALVTSAH